jgi:phage baseplate assembly protein W
MDKINPKQDSLAQRIGADLSFPIVNNFEPIDGLDLLLQDIQLLLLTVPNERVNLPNYGCNLRNQIWENIDVAFQNGAAEIKSALTKFEPRITVANVTGEINRNTSLILFNIRFIVNATNTQVNLVFPLRTASQLSAG